MRIRDARESDWPAIAALLAELGRPDVLDTEDEEAHRQSFGFYLARPDAVALVAEYEGTVIGFVDMEFRPRLNFLALEAWIPDLVVSEAHRSAGAGRALLGRAVELAKARGCWGISLESATWRTRAHAFYEREEWERTGASFSKSLSEQVWPPPPPAGSP